MYDNDRVFICDIETTGTDSMMHDILEFTYLLPDTGEIYTVYRTWTDYQSILRNADPKALEVNGYSLDKANQVAISQDEYEIALDDFARKVTDRFWVNANPAFDSRFMKHLLWAEGYGTGEPWMYKVFDIQAYASGVLNLDDLVSFSKLSEIFRNEGFPIGVPDHTSRGDVLAVRDCWNALRFIKERRIGA